MTVVNLKRIDLNRMETKKEKTMTKEEFKETVNKGMRLCFE